VRPLETFPRVPDDASRYPTDIATQRKMLTRDECLAFLESAVLNPPPDPPLSDWVAANLDSLEAAFDRCDFLKLKHRGLGGARSVLERVGRLAPLDLSYGTLDFNEKLCRYCGAALFWALPGKTTRADIVRFAQLIGDKEIESDGWVHPGVYCPNGCTMSLFNIAPRESGDEPYPWMQDGGFP
jgi:hypothetical protein